MVFSKTEVNIPKLVREIRSSAIKIALEDVIHFGTELTITFKAELDSTDSELLSNIVEIHTVEDLPEFTTPSIDVRNLPFTDFRKNLKVSCYEAEGEAATIVSYDFTDKCTWYQDSVKVETVLTRDSLGHYQSENSHWIDLTHGRLYDEDNINVGGKYNPNFKDPAGLPLNPVTINYKEGYFTMPEEYSSEITVTYYYATSSFYRIRPRPGKVLSIKTAELQFTEDVVIGSPFHFEVWADYQHPTLGLIQVPVPGTKIAYKNAKDFVSAANGGQGLIPAWGGLGNLHVFPFLYARTKSMKSSLNVELRVYIKDHTPVAGQFATCTFYIISEDEAQS